MSSTSNLALKTAASFRIWIRKLTTGLVVLWSAILGGSLVRGATFNIADGDVAALVAAMQTANTNRADDVINLAAGGTYVLTTPADGASGLPSVGNDGEFSGFHRLTINGNGATIARSSAPGTPDFRLFTANNSASGVRCTVIGVHFRNGYLSEGSGRGGGVSVGGGDLALINCTISDCSAPIGGGLSCFNGTLDMLNCAVFDNHAQNFGGALANGPEANRDAYTILNNCTFTRNTARLFGSFIHNDGTTDIAFPRGGATVRLVHCTIVNGEIYNNSFNYRGIIIFNNTILDRVRMTLYTNPGNDENKFLSEGRNLCSGDGDGYLTDPTDQLNTQPLLDPAGLRPNGGLTPTLALVAGSPAIDRGTSAGSLIDQRGSPRPSDLPFVPNAAGSDGSDIGAYEVAQDPVQQSPLVVTTLADRDDGVAGLNDCTLREAVARANTLPRATITFAPGLSGTITLDRNLGPLIVNSSIALDGPGARVLAISGGGYIRLLHFASGASSIRGLTLRDGNQSFGNVGASVIGGGILNDAILALEDCALIHHVALGATGASGGGTPGAGGSARGAAIYNTGSLWLLRCTVADCVAGGGYGTDSTAIFGAGAAGGSAEGSALYNAAGAFAEISVSSIIRNSASGAAGGNANFGGRGGNGTGGAIHNLGTLLVESSTISQNYGGGAPGGDGSGLVNDGPNGIGNGGVFNVDSGVVNIRNTIVAGNTVGGASPAPDVRGSFASLGFNLIGVTNQSTGFMTASDLTGSALAPLNPVLGPLANNGGNTDTVVPLNGSPAIDRGLPYRSGTDQRGLPRPLDVPQVVNGPGSNGSDIGAVETDAALPATRLEVNTLDDHDDGVASYVDCSLREAIRVANGSAAPAIITFRPGLRGTMVVVPALGILTISNSMEIVGPGARHLILDGGNVTPILRVAAGDSTIAGLTFARGRLTGAPARGGAILNEARLTLDRCWVRDSLARGTAGLQTRPGGLAFGGGLLNATNATLRVNNSAFSGNRADGGTGGSSGRAGSTGALGGLAAGGAVFNETGAILFVNNSTFASNVVAGGTGGFGTVTGGAGGLGQGGALGNRGTMTLTSITAANNSAIGGPGGDGADANGLSVQGEGGGLAALSAASANQVRNSIVAGNQGALTGGSDLSGPFLSGGFNLIGETATTTYFNGPGDQSGTSIARLNPLLGPFRNEGGQTDSFSPLPGSPALDRGKAFGLTSDQRGILRTFDAPELANAPGGDGSDIGAVERQPSYAGPLQILSISPYGNGWRILLQGNAGKSYRLLRATSVDDFYAPQGSVVAADGLGVAEFLDFDVSRPRYFYRGSEAP